jgi:hypothetical protein
MGDAPSKIQPLCRCGKLQKGAVSVTDQDHVATADAAWDFFYLPRPDFQDSQSLHEPFVCHPDMNQNAPIPCTKFA